MGKKEVIGILATVFIVVISLIVYAAPNAIITLTPLSLYETNTQSFNLTINNLFGNEVINEINVSMPQFTITNATNFQGWQVAYQNTEIDCK